MNLKWIELYPEFQVDLPQPCGQTKEGRLKADKAKQLQEALDAEQQTVAKETRVYIRIADCGSHRNHGFDMPAYLHNRPHGFVDHMLRRLVNAEEYTHTDMRELPIEGMFSVHSERNDDDVHTVDFTKPSCTCPDFRKHKYPCKHFCVVFKYSDRTTFPRKQRTSLLPKAQRSLGPKLKKPAVSPRKVAAPKPVAAKPRTGAIEPAAKKRAVAAKPAAVNEDSSVRTISDASEADAEDDGAFEALVLDADDDEEVPPENAGDGETGVEDDSASAPNEGGVAVSADENAEGEDAGAGEADEAPGDDAVDEEGNGDYAGEPEEGAEGCQGDAEGADYEGDGDAEVNPNEEGAVGEADYAEGDEMGDVEHPAEDGLEGDNALDEHAPNDAPEPSADDGVEALENGVSAEPEHEEAGEDVAAAATASGDGEGETIVRDLAPSERDFVMAEVEEIKDEPTTEVTRLWDLCPDVELDGAETITASVHETIQRSVRQFIERLLRDAKETGTVPDEELSKFHCRVCHISVPCKDHLVGHLRSDRHLCLSKSLNVHPKYSEHLLSQHFPKDSILSRQIAGVLLACGRRCAVLRYSRGLLEGSGGRLRVPRSGSTVLLPGLGLCGRGAETLAMGASTPDLLTAPGLCPSSGMLMAFSLFFCLTAKEQKGADKRPDKGKASAGSGQQSKREQSPPPIVSSFIFHCELCEVIGYNEDQIQEHYRGKKHRAKMAEELEKLSNKKQDTAKKAFIAGPKFGGGGPTYTCYVCNVVLHSTRDYSQHFTTRAHRMATGLQSSAPPFDRKRPRSPSPFSRPPAWSPPPRMRSPPRDLWSGGPPQRIRSPEPFLDPMARDLFAPPSGPGGGFEPGFRGPQGGMIEDYAERRGPSGGGGSGMPDPTSVAATLETMIQLQQRLLNITGREDSGGYHDEEFQAVARNLQDMDLQKSLQQLRQSQRYSRNWLGLAVTVAGKIPSQIGNNVFVSDLSSGRNMVVDGDEICRCIPIMNGTRDRTAG
ncbi:hypothetical protein HPB49_008879 [Dermacentor silvarum]|uniref:Uncharacterized protein n=1 Tax=Dermacentor silvarum TaxID=543639 RepID=A0ACB8C8G7_DERSI|nr:hypothetical protein HPB49_008879 [Dermacentor silvarum]